MPSHDLIEAPDAHLESDYDEQYEDDYSDLASEGMEVEYCDDW